MDNWKRWSIKHELRITQETTLDSRRIIRLNVIYIVPLNEGSELTLGDVVIHEMCVEEEGNVNPRQDPHGELVNKNVLTRIHSKVMQKIKVGVEMTNLIIEISIPKPSHFAWTKSDLKTVSEFIVHN